MGKEANPIPQGKYVPATRFGNFIFTAGMTSRKNGVLMKSGKIGLSADLEEYREAVVQAAKNALTAAENKLEEGEKLVQILSITVYVNAEEALPASPRWRIWLRNISARCLARPVSAAGRRWASLLCREALRWKFPSQRRRIGLKTVKSA